MRSERTGSLKPSHHATSVSPCEPVAAANCCGKSTDGFSTGVAHPRRAIASDAASTRKWHNGTLAVGGFDMGLSVRERLPQVVSEASTFCRDFVGRRDADLQAGADRTWRRP